MNDNLEKRVKELEYMLEEVTENLEKLQRELAEVAKYDHSWDMQYVADELRIEIYEHLRTYYEMS